MMMGDTRDLEEQCEDAVFEICDARERYPLQCTEELDKYLQLKNKIVMEPVILKEIPQEFEIPSRMDPGIRGTPERDDATHIWLERAKNLQSMTNKIRDLKEALQQLEDNKNYELKHHL